MSAEIAQTPLPVSGLTQARMPRVNLLPPEIAEGQALRRLQAGLVAIVVLAAVATGGYCYLQRGKASSAKQTVAQQTRRTAAEQARVNSLSSVTTVYSEVDAAKATLDQAMGDEVLWSHYLTDLSLMLPNNLWLTNLTFTQTQVPGSTPAAAQGVRPRQLLPGATDLGTVAMSGVAMTRNDVAAWLHILAMEKGYAAPYASSVTETQISGTTTVAYDWTVNVLVTNKALSNRAKNLLGD